MTGRRQNAIQLFAQRWRQIKGAALHLRFDDFASSRRQGCRFVVQLDIGRCRLAKAAERGVLRHQHITSHYITIVRETNGILRLIHATPMTIIKMQVEELLLVKAFTAEAARPLRRPILHFSTLLRCKQVAAGMERTLNRQLNMILLKNRR